MPLLIVALEVVLLLILMIVLKLNGFIPLILVSLTVGVLQEIKMTAVINSI